MGSRQSCATRLRLLPLHPARAGTPRCRRHTRGPRRQQQPAPQHHVRTDRRRAHARPLALHRGRRSAQAETDPSAVFRQGLDLGAAIFERLEGCFWADDSCYFVATSGGDARAGQVWRYAPDTQEEGWLTLVFESPARDILDAPDNICVSPRGAIIICEDGAAEQFIRGLTRNALMVDLVRQPVPERGAATEFAGCCFTPDGTVLFFNIQGSRYAGIDTPPGTTYALWGPWQEGAL